MTAAALHPALRLSEAFARSMQSLHRALGERARVDRSPAFGLLLIAIWSYLQQKVRAFDAVARKAAAGQSLERPRASRPDTASPSSLRRLPPNSRRCGATLPARVFGWLANTVPEAAAIGFDTLRQMLGDPDMLALLERSPRLRRMIRSLCWALRYYSDLLPPVLRPRRPRRHATAEWYLANAGQRAERHVPSQPARHPVLVHPVAPQTPFEPPATEIRTPAPPPPARVLAGPAAPASTRQPSFEPPDRIIAHAPGAGHPSSPAAPPFPYRKGLFYTNRIR